MATEYIMKNTAQEIDDRVFNLPDNTTSELTVINSSISDLQIEDAALDTRIQSLEDAEAGVSLLQYDISVTVGTNGDLATMNEALEYLSTKYPTYKLNGIQAEMKIKTGFVASEQLCIKGLDFGWITISSEDAEVVVDSSAMVTVNSEWLPFISGDRANLPQINTIFTSDGVTHNTNTSYCGIYGDGGSINIEVGKGFKGFGCNVRAEHACSVNAKECVISDGYIGAWIVSSVADFKSADVTNNTYAGIMSYSASNVRAYLCDASGSGSGTATGSGGESYGFVVQHGGIISRTSATGFLSQTARTITEQGIIM